jgi:hypothetical protein
MLKLGILYKDNKVVNHRSLFKVILNPILKYYGYCIGSKFDNNEFKGYKIFKQKPSKKITYSLKTNDYDIIKRKRMIL